MMMARWVVVRFALFFLVAQLVVNHSQGHDRDGGDKSDEDATFTFDDIWNPLYRPKYFSGHWVKDELIYRDPENNVVGRDVVTDDIRVLVNSSVMSELGVSSYTFSPDGQFVLLAYHYKPVWRYSFRTKYTIYSLDGEGGLIEFPSNPELRGKELQYAAWVPDSLDLTFVYGNDLYYQSGLAGPVVRITNTGDETFIFNGIPDWLYEEDVLGSNVGHYWSPRGRHLVFATFNDTGVPVIEFPLYGPKVNVYGKTIRIAYPKAGDKSENGGPGPNSRGKLYVITRSHLADGNTDNIVEIPVPEEFTDEDHYFNHVTWKDEDHVIIVWTNRVQNVSIISQCDVTLVSCEEIYKEEAFGGWATVPWPKIIFTAGGQKMLTLLPKDEGASGAFKQVSLLDISAGSSDNPSLIFLTSGQAEVTSLYGYDPQRHLVYYQSTGGNPARRHVYRVGLEGAAADKMAAECLTCDMSEECQYVRATFNKNVTHALLHCSGPGVPTDAVYDVINNHHEMLEDNAKLRERLSKKALPTRTVDEISVGGGYKAMAEIFLPPESSKDIKKYPLLIKTYGGPGAQEVRETFPLGGSISNWLTYLGSSHQVAVASVDGRGSGGRGDKYVFELYRRMLTVEVEDQAMASRYFREKDYINSSKTTAIYGWSYGGEVSSHALGTYPDFGCAIAVAPVTSKRYYDTAYTERVLGFDSPYDNEAGYNGTDVMNKVEQFRNKKFLVAHGTADDNVHYMNTAQLIQALTQHEIQFENLEYIDQNHRIANSHAIRHLMRALTDFLVRDCWHMSQNGSDEPNNGSVTFRASLLQIIAVLLLAVWLYRKRVL